jgi:signal transduction histidine kinase
MDPVNILLVDDQPAKLLSYEVILQELGENLIKARSGREALEQLLKTEIAVILVDVHMPEQDGFELVEMIREHPRFQKTAIIFISAVMMAEPDRLRGYQAGAVDYISVPIVPEVLRAKVRVFVELHRKTRELERLNAELEQRVSQRTAELEASSAQLVALNDELERRIEARTREREEALAQLFESQKLDTIGQLTGGVAHDFNNLLTAILGFAEMTMDQLPEDDPRRADVAHILHAGESATALTRQLLAFSRKQILMPVVLDINELLRAVQGILRRLIGEDVELVVTLHAAPLHVHADRGQLEQVVMNLAVNARDAMPTGGVLRIETDVVHLDGAFAAAHPGALTGAHARLRLTDTGTGMAPEVLAHLFEPFFTTKEPGKGTGLGLATVYGIVKQSEGYVSAESVEGHGTTFFVYLPLVDKPVDCVIDTPVPQTLHGGETILVVEDQPEVREVIRNILERRGYQMLEAHDGASALERLRAQHEPVDLIVTDVVMPGMSGRELIARLDDRDVHVRVLYMSGYTDDEIVRRGVLDTGIDFLHKPFTREQLLTKIRAVLDRPAGARSEA